MLFCSTNVRTSLSMSTLWTACSIRLCPCRQQKCVCGLRVNRDRSVDLFSRVSASARSCSSGGDTGLRCRTELPLAVSPAPAGSAETRKDAGQRQTSEQEPRIGRWRTAAGRPHLVAVFQGVFQLEPHLVALHVDFKVLLVHLRLHLR